MASPPWTPSSLSLMASITAISLASLFWFLASNWSLGAGGGGGREEREGKRKEGEGGRRGGRGVFYLFRVRWRGERWGKGV